MLFLLACVTSESETKNTPPEPPEVAISPASATTDQDLVVVVLREAFDTDGDEVAYRYQWFVDGAFRADLTGTTVPAAETVKGQAWRVVVTPDDGRSEGATAEASASVINTPPTVALEAPAAPGSSEDLAVTAVTGDADDDSVTLTWTWAVDGVASDVTGPTVPAAELARGQSWTVTATPFDGEEAGSPASATVAIANAPPTVASVSLNRSELYEGDTVTASVVGADDADGDTVALTYSWYVNGAIVREGESAVLTSAYFGREDVVAVAVTPNDGLVDGEPAWSPSVVVLDTAPEITGVGITPSPAHAQDELTCVATTDDVDGDPVSVSYSWTIAGSLVGTGGTLAAGTAQRDDVVVCTVDATDGTESAPSASASVTVENASPTLASVTLSPTSPTESDTLTATVSGASDPDGDGVSWAYAWYVNGLRVATTGSINGASFDRGDSVYVEVTPWDGRSFGSVVTSSPVTVANSAPEIVGVALTPSPAYTASTLTASATTYDADDDAVSVTYAWYVNGVPASAGSTLSGSAFAKGDSVYATATPSDGTSAGSALASSTVVISNTAPTAPTLTLSPTDPEETDDLICSISSTSSDVDGDRITYTFAWTNDGVPYTGATTTIRAGDTVPASATADDEEWICTVTASDSTDSSSASVSTVVGPLLLLGDVDIDIAYYGGYSYYSYIDCQGTVEARLAGGIITGASADCRDDWGYFHAFDFEMDTADTSQPTGTGVYYGPGDCGYVDYSDPEVFLYATYDAATETLTARFSGVSSSSACSYRWEVSAAFTATVYR